MFSPLGAAPGADGPRGRRGQGRDTRWRRLGRVLAFLLALLVPVLAPVDAQAGNPDLKWKTLQTEHFWIHYQAGAEEAADRTAMLLERAYGELSVAWGHRVYLRTHVVLSDSTDVANGRAGALPFPIIFANVTAPESLSVLEAHDDWLNILLTHELVHVVHLDTVHGLYRAANAVLGFGVLGKVSTPNILQPRWIVEGVATHEESDDTSAGRGRSAQFDMFLRTAVLEGQFQTIDQVSSGARIYPHGTSVYLYGLHLFRYIAYRYGEDKLRDLSHIYARQIVPYGINRAVEETLGVDFYQLWAEFRAYTEQRFKDQARRIRAKGVREGRRLTYSGETTRYPFWSPDDSELYFYKADGHELGRIVKLPSTGGRVREGLRIGRQGADMDLERVFEVLDVSRGSFVGASNQIVFDMMANHDYRYQWSDLHLYGGGDPLVAKRLTHGLRANEADVSPDGRTVAFRRNDIAQSRLGFMDLATGDVVEVAPSERIEQVYSPRWAPDGQRVAFSGWREGGYRDLYIYDRVTGKTQRITADRYLDLAPAWTPDGEYLIFSSDRDDVFNLYAYHPKTGDFFQVSNVFGGAFEPAVSHDGTRIAYIGFSSRGYDAWVMPLDRKRWLPVAPPTSDRPMAPDPKPALAGDAGRPPSAKAGRYKAGRTFFPRTLFPTALEFQSSSFGTDLGLSVQVVDVLGFHSLVGAFSYQTAFQAPTGSVSYTFNRLLPTFTVGFGRAYASRGGFRRYDYDHLSTDAFGDPVDGYEVSGYRERSTRGTAEIRVPVLRHPRRSVSSSARYQFTRYTNLDADQNRVDPNAPLSSLPETGDVAQVDLSMTFDSRRSLRFAVGNVLGTRIGVSMSVLHENLGGDFNDIQARASFTQFIPMPWLGHHVLALRLAAGASGGGLRRRGAFSVGGLVEDEDVVRSFVSRTPFNTAGSLRGYQPGAFRGRYFSVLNTEYRIPLIDADRGVGTLPFFLQRITMSPLVDGGYAWSDQFRFRDLRWSVGAALAFTFRLGYVEPIELWLQYAHGLDPEDGLDVFRVVVAQRF